MNSLDKKEIKNIPLLLWSCPHQLFSSTISSSKLPSLKLIVHNSLWKVQQRVHTLNFFCLLKNHKSRLSSNSSMVIRKELTQPRRYSFCSHQQSQLRLIQVWERPPILLSVNEVDIQRDKSLLICKVNFNQSWRNDLWRNQNQ